MPIGATEIVKLKNSRIEIDQSGRGAPVLLLHGEDGFELGDSAAVLTDHLAGRHTVYRPRMPGFGKSTLPDTLRDIDEMSYEWLDLLDNIDLKGVTIIGFSVGGWLALEMAAKSCARLRRLVLTGSVGLKFGDAYDRDIGDIYFHNTADVRAMRFHDPAADPHLDLTTLTKREALALAKQREAIAKLCWEPYFHTPSLRSRLHRVTLPTLVVQGMKDRMTPTKYGRALARELPNARYVGIPRAGHFPHIEQPDAFVDAVDAFFRETGRKR
tara:strand:+ start:864 stop:1673 length:810 start_codon:yes stop_codon:yes gene_type:complete